MSLIKDYLKNSGYKVLSDEFYDTVDKWLSWYSGKVKSFHSYTQFNGKTNVSRSRATLGMAKKVCEDWANLLLNERVDINIANKKLNSFVQEVLKNNNFRMRANRLIELVFALGSGAFVEYTDKIGIKIDCIRASMIYPLSWSGDEITECAFASEKIIDGRSCTYLNLHLLENGNYKIINKLFLNERDTLTEISLPEGIAPETDTGSSTALFQIITPNIVNSVDLDNPLGMSVFGDAIDILKGIDLVYDSYQNEFRLGKKRILVPAGMAQMQNGASGITPIFDDNDTEFYAMADRTLTDLKEINMTLRAEPHELALQKNIDLLCMKCGLGTNRYTNKGLFPKTATEVVSERSDLYMNVRKNELVLESALIRLTKAILQLGGFKTNSEIGVYFDDSIIEDSQVVAARALSEFKNNIISKDEYLQRVYGLTETGTNGKEE